MYLVRYRAIRSAHVDLFKIDLIQLLIDKIDELTKDVKRIQISMLQPMPDPSM
jgi:hypothetical protein